MPTSRSSNPAVARRRATARVQRPLPRAPMHAHAKGPERALRGPFRHLSSSPASPASADARLAPFQPAPPPVSSKPFEAMGLLVEPATAAVQPDILLGASAAVLEQEPAPAPKRTHFRPDLAAS